MDFTTDGLPAGRIGLYTEVAASKFNYLTVSNNAAWAPMTDAWQSYNDEALANEQVVNTIGAVHRPGSLQQTTGLSASQDWPRMIMAPHAIARRGCLILGRRQESYHAWNDAPADDAAVDCRVQRGPCGRGDVAV